MMIIIIIVIMIIVIIAMIMPSWSGKQAEGSLLESCGGRPHGRAAQRPT